MLTCSNCGSEIRETQYADYWICRNGHVHSLKLRCGDRKPVFHVVATISIPEERRHMVYDFVRVQVEPGRRKSVGLHRLIAHAWLPPKPSPGSVLRHIDGNRFNNTADNLAWGTTMDNHNDRRAHGRSFEGERNGRAVLTEQQVFEIRRRAALGESRISLSRAFGCSNVMVSYIVRRKNWKHVA